MGERVLVYPLATAVLVFFFVLAAEMLHARRISCVAPLAFGPEGKPRGWVRSLALVRAFCLAGISWSLLTLLQFSVGGGAGDDADVSAEQQLVFMVDVSPSMDIKDAGPDGMLLRSERLRDVVVSLLGRMGRQVRYTVVCFYTRMVPIARQALDKNLVENVFDGLPIGMVMPPGKTDLGDAVRQTFEFIKDYPEKSVTLVVCTDGDSKPVGDMGIPPASLKSVLLLGVGDPGRGTPLDGHMSRQEVAVLRGISRDLHGKYLNVNKKHIPSSALGDMCDRGSLAAGAMAGRRTLALWMLALLSLTYALIPPALEFFGSGWRVVGRATERGGI
jgi:Ca-activated chloride channel family protein